MTIVQSSYLFSAMEKPKGKRICIYRLQDSSIPPSYIRILSISIFLLIYFSASVWSSRFRSFYSCGVLLSLTFSLLTLVDIYGYCVFPFSPLDPLGVSLHDKKSAIPKAF
ncbi:unnamed protein product [Citrullus colocynthis]|uniref:Uncharacterized protein n=1 Tax=Citrullus colocynthis TaxID=252529 RepID=A0ABP0YAI5_9ROSI